MKLNILPDVTDIRDEKVEGRIAVVIDVLRATSVMSAALNNGAQCIVPVSTIDDCITMAARLKQQYDRVLRVGERNTFQIEGFDLGNSPLSYTKEMVDGAIIVMTTTNGTRTINSCSKADEIIVGSLLNANSVADYISASGKDAVLVCSGRRKYYTLEDGYCAGYMASLISKKTGCYLSDFAWEQMNFYERYAETPRTVLEHCEHYRNIKDTLQGDVDYCLQRNIFERIPKIYYNENGGYQEIR